jgi:hypothetical protein
MISLAGTFDGWVDCPLSYLRVLHKSLSHTQQLRQNLHLLLCAALLSWLLLSFGSLAK